MRNRGNRGLVYIVIAVLFATLAELHQANPITVGSFLEATAMLLLILAVVGELGFWIWSRISN